MNTVFPYPGGKSYLAEWIIGHFPKHHCYVEPFGGGASVMANKEPSSVEIYNDQDGDLVHFFRTLRDHAEELAEWVNQRPYAKDLHEKYGRQFYDGYRPDNDIERAGRFFYLRQSQFSGKYPTFSGFSSSKKRSHASGLRKSVGELEGFGQRFHDVVIENRDYSVILERFDSEDTLFYCDPPYLDVGETLYTNDGFNHGSFCDLLAELDGYWIVSYEKVPEPLEDYHTVEREQAQTMNNNHESRRETRTERLIMNYDPDETPLFEYAGQASVSEFL